MGLETRLKRETWNRFKDSMIKKGFEERWFCDGMKCIDIGPDCVAEYKINAWIGKDIEKIKTAEECEEISRMYVNEMVKPVLEEDEDGEMHSDETYEFWKDVLVHSVLIDRLVDWMLAEQFKDEERLKELDSE